MDDYGSPWKAMKESPASVILIVYSFIFLWFVGGLTCFHLYLIGRNQVSLFLFFSGNHSFLVLEYF
jgi:palmitoyltransferase ZDHHC9/14/18